MEKIKFSKKHGYYEKFCKSLVTTVRRWTPDKEKYYRGRIGKVFEIEYTDYDFTGIPKTDLLMLIFEIGNELGLKLLQVIKCHYNDLSEEFIKYDTETYEDEDSVKR